MKVFKKVFKFIFAGNVAVLFALILLPIFLITDQIGFFQSLLDYLWKE